MLALDTHVDYSHAVSMPALYQQKLNDNVLWSPPNSLIKIGYLGSGGDANRFHIVLSPISQIGFVENNEISLPLLTTVGSLKGKLQAPQLLEISRELFD